jgi:AbrB family transcriptional regulator (stage V sporulation protein T)
MKSTGIVRRIDDLGRIVIPKEIRRNLYIKDNEEIEFFIENDQIVLKKFSRIFCLEDISNKIISIVHDLTNKVVLIGDKEKFIYGSGLSYKDYLGKTISKGLEEVFSTRQLVCTDGMLGYPIISYGDVIGLVVLVGEKSKQDIDIIKLVAQFLGKYVED